MTPSRTTDLLKRSSASFSRSRAGRRNRNRKMEMSRWIMASLPCGAQNAANDDGQPFPVGGLFAELLAALSGERVVFGLTVVLRRGPARAYPALFFKAMQCGYSDLIHLQDALGDLLN